MGPLNGSIYILEAKAKYIAHWTIILGPIRSASSLLLCFVYGPSLEAAIPNKCLLRIDYIIHAVESIQAFKS